MLKIISGTKKNALIAQPPSTTRPTMQRVRKTIFDMIFSKVKGKVVVDCFAGSGAMGFEALSIGAEHAFFIEKDQAAFEVVRSNAAKLGFEEKSTIVRADFFKVNSYKRKIDRKIDIAFIDPPYGKFSDQEILKALEEIMPDGLAIFETNSPVKLSEEQILEKKQIADKYITFFKIFGA